MNVRDQIQEPVPAIAVETTFRAMVIVRGALPSSAEFVLFHFRERNREGLSTAGPMLVDFAPRSGDQYLMFLKRLKDGRYEAFNRNEPGSCIEKLAQRLLLPADGSFRRTSGFDPAAA